jgi:hypothetical protein
MQGQSDGLRITSVSVALEGLGTTLRYAAQGRRLLRVNGFDMDLMGLFPFIPSRPDLFTGRIEGGSSGQALPRLSGYALRQILPVDVERYVAKRICEVAPANVNRELQFLKPLFNVAIADGKADTNPVRG